MITGKVFSIRSKSSSRPLLRLFHSVVLPGVRPYEEHRHTAFEISLVCKGRGVYKTEQARYPFAQGDLFLFRSNEPHCIIEIAGNTPLDLLNLQFEPRLLWRSEDLLFQARYSDILFWHHGQAANHIPSRQNMAGELEARLKRMEREFTEEQTDHQLMVRMLVQELLICIRRYKNWQEPAEKPWAASHLAQMENALDYIDQHLTQKLDLAGIAKQAAMCPSYFCTQFKKLNGVSLWEYIRLCRIELAISRLCATQDGIAQIALDCGFNSISNFNRCFRMVTGSTPKDYRRRCSRGRPF